MAPISLHYYYNKMQKKCLKVVFLPVIILVHYFGFFQVLCQYCNSHVLQVYTDEQLHQTSIMTTNYKGSSVKYLA